MADAGILFGGGKLEEAFVLPLLQQYDSPYIIGVDRGMEFLRRQGIIPQYLIGDFDSVDADTLRYYREETAVPMKECPPVKDASDTELAIRLALQLSCTKLLILGATGGRIDHLLANIQCLTIPFEAGVDASILDSRNRIRLIQSPTTMQREGAFGSYFSLFPLGSDVTDLSIEGARYPLQNHLLTSRDSLCVSNEFAADKVTISFSSGKVLLVESRDQGQDETKRRTIS